MCVVKRAKISIYSSCECGNVCMHAHLNDGAVLGKSLICAFNMIAKESIYSSSSSSSSSSVRYVDGGGGDGGDGIH